MPPVAAAPAPPAPPLEARRYAVEVRIGGKWKRLSSPVWKGYGGVSLLAPRKGKRYGTFDYRGVAGAVKWITAGRGAARHVTGRRVTMLNPYPHLVLDKGTRWPAPSLCAKLERIGAALGRRVIIREGTRTHEQQQAFWREFVERGYAPPLVARPGTSNHEDRNGDGYGEAADCGVQRKGAGTYERGTNIAEFPGARTAMKAVVVCCPVTGETWHVEEGTRWAA